VIKDEPVRLISRCAWRTDIAVDLFMDVAGSDLTVMEVTLSPAEDEVDRSFNQAFFKYGLAENPFTFFQRSSEPSLFIFTFRKGLSPKTALLPAV
jgi:hypothetical protein